MEIRGPNRCRHLALGSLVAALVALTSPTVLAQTTSAPPESGNRDVEARGIFDAGRAAYSDGRFAEALEYFNRALELSGRPEMYYNVGTAAERAGEPERAVEAFEAYLQAVPEATNRGEVEARMRSLRAQAEADAPATDPDAIGPGATDPGAEQDDGPGLLPWILTGTGGALTIGGVVLLVVGAGAIGRVSDAPQGASWADYSDDHEGGPTLANVGIAIGAAGLALATVGVVLLVSGGESGEREAEVSVGPAGATLRGRF